MSKYLVFSVLAALAFSVSSSAHADFKRICRGGNLPAYRVEIKRAVKAKLAAASIAYNRVDVKFTNIRRTNDILSPDFATGLTLSNGTVPSVTYAGTFPGLTTCTIQANLRVLVKYPTGTSITKSAVNIPGTLLYKVPFHIDGGLGNSPLVD